MNKIFVTITILICLSLLMGCIDDDDKGDFERTIIKTDTIGLMNTIYGEVNLSYQFIRESESDKTVTFYNITLDIENPTENLSRITIYYESPERWEANYITMVRSNNKHFFCNIFTHSDLLDLWVDFYERGEKEWNETFGTYLNSSYLTEMISGVISKGHFSSEMKEELKIYDIHYGYDILNTDHYNISFNISGTSTPLLVLLHHQMNFNNTGSVPSHNVVYGTNNGSYYAIINFKYNEKEVIKSHMDFLYFSIAISNQEYLRVTSPIYKVVFD